MTTANLNNMNESQIAGMMGISVEEYRKRNKTPKLSPEIQASIDAARQNSQNNIATIGQSTAKSQRRGGVLRYPLEALNWNN